MPICKYNGQKGTNIAGYNQTFCDKNVFQPTFNEYGMCFTFNNRKQGMDEYFHLKDRDNATEENEVINSSQQSKYDATNQHNTENNEREILKVNYALNLNGKINHIIYNIILI